MADSPEPPTPHGRAGEAEGEWDAAAVLNSRADETRAERDKAIAHLRETMTDEDILDTFGIDLPEIER